MRRLSAATAQQALLILLSLVSLYPIWFTLQTALKSPKSYALDPTGLPREPTLANFHDLFAAMPFGLWTLNSVIVAFVSVAAATAISVLAAYAIAFGRHFIGNRTLWSDCARTNRYTTRLRAVISAVAQRAISTSILSPHVTTSPIERPVGNDRQKSTLFKSD